MGCGNEGRSDNELGVEHKRSPVIAELDLRTPHPGSREGGVGDVHALDLNGGRILRVVLQPRRKIAEGRSGTHLLRRGILAEIEEVETGMSAGKRLIVVDDTEGETIAPDGQICARHRCLGALAALRRVSGRQGG